MRDCDKGKPFLPFLFFLVAKRPAKCGIATLKVEVVAIVDDTLQKGLLNAGLRLGFGSVCRISIIIKLQKGLLNAGLRLDISVSIWCTI